MSLRVSLPVYVRISLCVPPYVPPYVSLCVPLRVSLPSNLFVYPSMCLSVCPSPCVIICVPLRVSVRTGAAGVVFRPDVSIGLMQFGSGASVPWEQLQVDLFVLIHLPVLSIPRFGMAWEQAYVGAAAAGGPFSSHPSTCFIVRLMLFLALMLMVASLC